MENIQNLELLTSITLEFYPIKVIHLKFKEKTPPKNGSIFNDIASMFESIDELYQRSLKEVNPIVQRMFCETFLKHIKSFNNGRDDNDNYFASFLDDYDHLGIFVHNTETNILKIKKTFDDMETMRPMLEAWHLDKEINFSQIKTKLGQQKI